VISFGSAPAQINLVQSAAGGAAQSDNYDLIATVGQTSPAAVANGSQFTLYSGFIYTLDISAFDIVEAPFNLSYGIKQENYRIISIPAIVHKPHPMDVLVDDLGEYNKKKWRLFDTLDGKKAGTEYPNTRYFDPGVGLFIIIRENNKTFDIENGSWVEIKCVAFFPTLLQIPNKNLLD
jgi:hypothetical protein